LIAIIQLLLIVACVSRINEEEILKFYFNTDYLYLPSLYRDIFIDHHSISGWSLTPAPYFFPDMLLYFLISFFSPNISYTLIVYAWLQFLCIVFLFFKIAQMMIADKQKVQYLIGLSCFCLQIFLLAGAIGHEAFTAHLLLTNASHLGAVLMSLICFYFLFKYFTVGNRKSLAWMGVIIITAVISDRLFVIQTLAPIMFLALYYVWRKKDPRPLIYAFISGIVGWILFELIRRYLIHIPYETRPPYTTSGSFQNFIKGFKFILRHFTFHSFILFFHLAMLVISPFAYFLMAKNTRYMYLGFIFSCIFSFVFPILYGFIGSIDTHRYLMHSYIFILLLSPILMGLLFRKNALKYISLVITILYVGSVLVWVGLDLKIEKLNYFLHYRPGYVELVDNHHTKLKSGIGDYWNSKQFYLFGKNTTRVVAVYSNCEGYAWEANKYWYLGKEGEAPPVFNFSYNLKIDSILGPPIDSIQVASDCIYIYPDFVFKEGSNSNLIILLQQ
jgi:hypothetical protein